MPIPNTIADLSSTAGSNSPAGSDPPTEGDNYLRAIQAILRQEHDNLSGTAGATFVGFIQTGTGAVNRTALSKMREVVSVTDFGAVGDGTANDRVACRLTPLSRDLFDFLVTRIAQAVHDASAALQPATARFASPAEPSGMSVTSPPAIVA